MYKIVKIQFKTMYQCTNHPNLMKKHQTLLMSTRFVLSRFYTINKFERSVHLNFVFFQIRMICTSNVHNFLLNFHDFVLSTKSNFSTSLEYLYIKCTQLSIEFSQFGTFNNFDFPLRSHDFVCSTILKFSSNQDDQYISTQF